MSSSDKQQNIVFFDSECVLCGNFLKLLLKIDKKEKLSFASLQSDWSAEKLPKEFVQASDYKSVAFSKNGVTYFYGDAVIQIFNTIGGFWKIFNVGYLLPQKWRKTLYMKVSDNRYSWFGKSDQCLIPDERMRSRFVHEIKVDA